MFEPEIAIHGLKKPDSSDGDIILHEVLKRILNPLKCSKLNNFRCHSFSPLMNGKDPAYVLNVTVEILLLLPFANSWKDWS